MSCTAHKTHHTFQTFFVAPAKNLNMHKAIVGPLKAYARKRKCRSTTRISLPPRRVMINFCPVCANMLYLSAGSNSRTLLHVCKNCNTTQELESQGASLCISETLYGDAAAAAHMFADPAIKHDPTLPRVSHIACPRGEQCSGHRKQQEVIYIKHNATQLRYLYFCCHCDNFWTA